MGGKRQDVRWHDASWQTDMVGSLGRPQANLWGGSGLRRICVIVVCLVSGMQSRAEEPFFASATAISGRGALPKKPVQPCQTAQLPANRWGAKHPPAGVISARPSGIPWLLTLCTYSVGLPWEHVCGLRPFKRYALCELPGSSTNGKCASSRPCSRSVWLPVSKRPLLHGWSPQRLSIRRPRSGGSLQRLRSLPPGAAHAW